MPVLTPQAESSKSSAACLMKVHGERLFKPLGMKDTTFWPNEEQLSRLAKSYEPNKANTDLVEIPITQLRYPLSDRTLRFPMPAGGLFSTASDVAAFCQMLLNGGQVGGKQILSRAAVQQMTSTQTGDLRNKGKDEYGYGFGLETWSKINGDPKRGGGGAFGHGGDSNEMHVSPGRNLIFIYMVQHNGYANDDGKQIYQTFEKAAVENFRSAERGLLGMAIADQAAAAPEFFSIRASKFWL